MPCSVLAHFGPLSHGKAASFTPPTSGGARLPDVFTGLLSSLLPKGSAAVRQNLAEAGVPEAPLKASDAVTDQVAPPTADTVLTARAPTATAVPGGKAPVGKVQADGGIGRKPTHETLGRSGGLGSEVAGNVPAIVPQAPTPSTPIEVVPVGIQPSAMMPMRVSVASTSTSTSTSTSVSPGTAPNAKPEDVQKTLEPHRGAAAAARAEPTVQTEQSSTAGGSTAPAVAEVRPERVTPLIDIVADTAALTAQSEAPQTIAPGVVAAASQRVVQDQPDPTTVGAAPIDQVAPALVGVLNATDGTQSVTVRLQPSELGQVTIRVDRSSEGMAHVNITADRPETLQLLQRDEPRLQQTLDQAGVPSSGRSVTFQATPPDQVGASAARPDTMEAGSGGSGQGQSGGAWRESGDGRQSSGNDADSNQQQARERWYRVGLDITA